MHSAAVISAFVLLLARSSADDTTPKPIVIPASEYFEGNDGPWSTFDIRVGTPEQDVRVLVSTASPQSMVVVSDGGCSTSVFEKVPADCAVSRGNLFNVNKSTSWHDGGTYGINQNGVGLEANLGYSQRAQFALEHMGIGLAGPSFINQTVAGIATPEPFYLGIFGLNSQPVNFSSLGNYSAPSFLTTLKAQKEIPSISWSYTAGAKYRLKQVYGQLIFSGYDTSRFEENSVSFTMADDVTRDLVVGLQSISYSGSTSTTLLSNAIDIYVDSTDPNIWLPSDVCDAFEQAFDLKLDNKTGLYLVNETHHNTLLDSNAEVTFRLSDVKSGGDTVAITLPYAAFDLTAEYPLVDNSSHYFPLKRANDSTQYTLGRTFLQEAYLSADYERKVFNVSACTWNQGAEENLVTITSKDSDSAGGGGSSSGSSGLSGGAIAGIVIGCVVAGTLIALAFAFVILRLRRKWIGAGFAVAANDPEPDESVLKGPVFNTPSHSTAYNSMTLSAGTTNPSAPESSVGRSTSAVDSPARPATVNEDAENASTPELDGQDTHIRPLTEVDGRETEIQRPVAENPGVYELPGSRVPGGEARQRPERPPHAAAPSSSCGEGAEENDSPPVSPSISTLGDTWGQGGTIGSDLVSPSTPGPSYGDGRFDPQHQHSQQHR